MGAYRSSSINTNGDQKFNSLFIVRLTELKCKGQKQGFFDKRSSLYLALAPLVFCSNLSTWKNIRRLVLCLRLKVYLVEKRKYFLYTWIVFTQRK